VRAERHQKRKKGATASARVWLRKVRNWNWGKRLSHQFPGDEYTATEEGKGDMRKR